MTRNRFNMPGVDNLFPQMKYSAMALGLVYTWDVWHGIVHPITVVEICFSVCVVLQLSVSFHCSCFQINVQCIICLFTSISEIPRIRSPRMDVSVLGLSVRNLDLTCCHGTPLDQVNICNLNGVSGCVIGFLWDGWGCGLTTGACTPLVHFAAKPFK